MMTKIWERYFFKEISKLTLFFLLAFFTLYSIIDYASHAASFHHNHVQFDWGQTFIYYGCELARRIDLLLPFALLVATIRQLSDWNIHHELIALMSSGLGLITLLRPLIFFGAICTFFIYFNTELIQPLAMKRIKEVEHLRSSSKHKSMELRSVQSLHLVDGSLLIYHHFNPLKQFFFDAYWIRNANDIYHIKYLYPNLEGISPNARFVDHFDRSEEDRVILKEQFKEKALNEMKFNREALFHAVVDPEDLSLIQLWEKLPSWHSTISEKESQLLASFYHKLIMPWLCLLVIIGPAPFCLQFTRQLPLFCIYMGSFLGLIILNLVITCSVTLAERQVLSPPIAIGVPFLSVLLLLLFRFYKMSSPSFFLKWKVT